MPMQTHGAPVSLSMSQQASNPRFPGRDPLNKPVLIKITQSAFWQMSKTATTMLIPETRLSSRRLIRRQNAGRNRHFRGQTELPVWQEGTLQLRMEGLSSRGRSLLPVRYISFHRPKSIHTLELPSASTEKATFKVQGVDDPYSHQEQSACIKSPSRCGKRVDRVDRVASFTLGSYCWSVGSTAHIPLNGTAGSTPENCASPQDVYGPTSVP
ncbi:hypothetical protein LY78DRAFT_157427 [Colletotrichum sublineola]|nr:hypothetical protein LY78DRAFT_157427 [Colletotrichum sublineola]